MRLMNRNMAAFRYYPLSGEAEILNDGMHTGNWRPTYGLPVEYYGTFSPPSGTASANLFGLNTQYTQVHVMDRTDAEIEETGLIEWKYGFYEITAVRPSLNVLSVALKKRTKNAAPPVVTEPVSEGETQSGTHGEGDGD